MTAADRQPWADYAKGLAITFVVCTHTVNGLIASHIMAKSASWEFWNDWLYVFQVPVFFFISGLFAGKSFEKQGPARFAVSRFVWLAYPYVLWQTLQILLMFASGGTTNSRPTLATLLSFPVAPYMQFWFIYCLLLVCLLYALLKAARVPDWLIVVLAAGMLLAPPTGWGPADELCGHMIYFALGLVAGPSVARVRQTPGVLLAIAAVLCGTAVAAAVQFEMGYASPYRPIGAIAGVAGVCFASFLLERTTAWRVMAVLGVFSLEIYVAHTICAATTRIALAKVLHLESVWPHVALGLSAGLLGPLALGWLAQRFGLPLFRPRRKKPSGRA